MAVSVPPELLSAARSAPFIFFGTVTSPGGSNVELLAGDEHPTAVVHVDEALVSPEAVGDLAGRDVTLRLAARAPARGSRHMFLATSMHFGDEVAVAEIGRVPRGRVEDDLRRVIVGEKLSALDDALAERLRAAAVVVYGVVLRIDSEFTEAVESAEPAGEARPGFRAAVLKVWRSLKGGGDADEPCVVFPFPRTQKWPEVPLFVEGQEGLWILQPARGQTLAAGAVKVPDVVNGFTALDPLDFQAPGMIARVEVLLAASPDGKR